MLGVIYPVAALAEGQIDLIIGLVCGGENTRKYEEHCVLKSKDAQSHKRNKVEEADLSSEGSEFAFLGIRM